MLTPERIYRYRTLDDRFCDDEQSFFEREIDAIENSYLYAASFKSMNDPMEAFYLVGNEGDQLVDKLIGGKINILSKFEEIISTTIDKLGLISFSSSHLEYPLWAYYAGNFSGICLEFDSSLLCMGDFRDESLKCVNYSSLPLPPISFGEFNIDAKDTALSRLTIKREEWAHEKEWRYVTGRVGKKYYSDNALARIFLGPRIASKHAEIIRNIVKNRDVEVVQLSVSGFNLTESTFKKETANNILDRVGSGRFNFDEATLTIIDDLKSLLGSNYHKFVFVCRNLTRESNMECFYDIYISKDKTIKVGIAYKLRNGREYFRWNQYDSKANLMV